MYYKKYGNTGIDVSAIGFGGMRFDEQQVKDGEFAKCAEVAVYAYEKGINYFDTAPYYNADHSETIIGKAVAQMERNKVYLSSKTNFGTIEGEPTRDGFFKRLETSLNRLQTDYIDFYHLWCVLNLESYEKLMDKLYGYFEEAKQQGMIRNIVVSSHMQGDDIQNIVNSDKFRGMLIGYNALNYGFRQSGIEKAYQKGMGVVAMNPLGGGTIPDNPEMFSYLTKDTDLSVAQAALRFVASHREITITLAGFTTTAQIDDAVKAVADLKEKPAQAIVEEYAQKGHAFNDLCTGCGYCVGCPVDIAIPKYMDSYNQMIFTGKGEKIKDRLNGMWGLPTENAGTCIACGICEKECTQHLPIIERLKMIAAL